MPTALHIHCLMFDDYETLDLMGPVELLAAIPDAQLHYVSASGGMVRSRQGLRSHTQTLHTLPTGSILLLPGGMGTRALATNPAFLKTLRGWVDSAGFCLCVCTGAALLAACGSLRGLAATTNKKAFGWVSSLDTQVRWQPVARWVRSGKFYTSSGVSAGMDMALGFIADHHGRPLADSIARHAEYTWHDNPSHDPFAALYGLHLAENPLNIKKDSNL